MCNLYIQYEMEMFFLATYLLTHASLFGTFYLCQKSEVHQQVGFSVPSPMSVPKANPVDASMQAPSTTPK